MASPLFPGRLLPSSFSLGHHPLLLLLAFLLLLLSPFCCASIADADSPVLSWSSSSNLTVGTSAEPSSPYLVLSIPVTVPHARAFLTVVNAHHLPVTLTVDGVADSQPILPTDVLTIPLDNSSSFSSHRFTFLHDGVALSSGNLDGVCVDCVVNLTLTERNSTEVVVTQPSYALEYTDRDDDSATLTSIYVVPQYPERSATPSPADENGTAVSFVLHFTFSIPIASFNFFPQYVLRQLPAASSVSRHPPTSTAERPAIVPLLHVPYYYTDILLPTTRSTWFQSGDVLVVRGGFSTNPFDAYCCRFNNSQVTYFSSCAPANTSDTFHCQVPPAVTGLGWNGETLTVSATYEPRPAAHMRGYYMRHLAPSGGDDDNTFSVDKPLPPMLWYDIRGWRMQALVAGGGALLLVLCVAVTACTWRRWREKKQRTAMERRAEEDGEPTEDARDEPLDVGDGEPLAIAVYCSDAAQPLPDTASLNSTDSSPAPPSSCPSSFPVHDAAPASVRASSVPGKKGSKYKAERRLSDIAAPLLFASSV